MLRNPYRIGAVLVAGLVSLVVSLSLGRSQSSVTTVAVAHPSAQDCRTPARQVVAMRAFTAVTKGGNLVCPYIANGITAFTENCQASYVRPDRRGIPRLPYGKTNVYNPGTIGMCGLGEYNGFLVTRGKLELSYAVAVADWFVDRQQPSGEWVYRFDYPVGAMGRTLHAPWGSAFAQAVGISLLSRVYEATGDPRYLRAAVRGIRPLERSVPDGGLTAHFLGHPFFEEYPTRPPTLALEGFMVTILGLYDLKMALTTAPLEEATAEQAATRLYTQGLATLRFALPFYDLGNISAYHLGHITNPPRAPAAFPAYHPRHVATLRILNSIAPDRILLYYANRWAAYKVPGVG